MNSESDKQEFSGWQAPFLSFWSPAFYRDVARKWKGVGYLYLLALISITSCLWAVQIQGLANEISDTIMQPVLRQMPSVSCQNGRLSINRKSPYTVHVGMHRPLIVFDLDWDDSKPPTMEQETLRICKHSLWTYTRSSYSSIAGDSKPHLVHVDIGPESIFNMTTESFVTTGLLCRDIAGFVAFLVAVTVFFFTAVFQSILYSAISYAAARLSHVHLSYPTVLRLTSVAFTPVILADSLRRLSSREVPHFQLLFAAIMLAYTLFALFSNRQHVQAIPSPDSQSPESA